MRYLGGKSLIANSLCTFLNQELTGTLFHRPKILDRPFVDLFCGACNIIAGIDKNRIRIANDKHYYLIEMWKALQAGWIPPKNITEKEYIHIKHNKDIDPALTGFAGFGCSFSGKWFSTYARGDDRNFCNEAYNGILKKIKLMKNVFFFNKDYKDIYIPKNALIYCDIPYKDTTGYKIEFDHNEFYEWANEKAKKHDIFVSEYKENVNEDKIVWECESQRSLRGNKRKNIKTTEVLIKI